MARQIHLQGGCDILGIRRRSETRNLSLGNVKSRDRHSVADKHYPICAFYLNYHFYEVYGKVASVCDKFNREPVLEKSGFNNAKASESSLAGNR